MKRRHHGACALVTAVALLGAASATTATATAAGVHDCGVFEPQADTGLYKITATNISCRKTRKILKHWYYRAGREQTYRPAGVAQRAVVVPSRRGPDAVGSRRIAWTQYSA